jgi:tRNA 2-thiouridine synthesizing protein A
MADPAPAEILIDARGHRCPVPTLKLRRALAAAAPGARLRLIATDPLARIDVPHLLGQAGGELVDVIERDGELSFVILAGAAGIAS